MPYVRKPRAKKAKRSARKPIRKTRKMSLIKTIKSVISRQAENKCWFDYGINQSIVQASTSCPVFRNLCPLLGQGTQKSQRVGNEVMVKSGYIRGHVNILQYNATTNPLAQPVYVKMWIVSCKTINTNAFSSTPFNEFFDILNSSAAFQANQLDIIWGVNKDQYTLHATKLIKVGVGYGAGTPNPPALAYYDNSSMTGSFYFNFGKHLKKLKYDDSDSIPTNRNLFFVIQAVNCDGSTGSTSYSPAEFHYSTEVHYEDM